jgi:methylmalonyl-CoA mutase N-terminal domain/subunit
VVGVNEFVTDESAPTALFAVDAGVAAALRERVARTRRSRPAERAERALEALEKAARGSANLMPPIIEAVEQLATLGEICDRLRAVFGTHQPSVTF